MSQPATAPWVKHYQPGVPAEIQLPESSLIQVLERSVAEGRSATALTFFGATTTYTELGDRVARAAEGLRRLGVKPGDRVALVLPNCPQHVVAFYAVLRLGAIVVEHNPLYTTRELSEIFANHGAKVAICWDSAVHKLRDMELTARPATIVAVNLIEAMPLAMRLALRLPLGKLKQARTALSSSAPGTIPWRKLLAHRPIARTFPRPRIGDLAAIQYTSGTTGHPKGAMLSHFNLYSNALQGEAWMRGAEYRKEVFYAILPMFHAFGMTLFLTYGIRKQANLVLFPKFDVDLVLKTARRLPPTVFCAVPPIYEKTAREAQRRGISLRSAKYCISGAMTLGAATAELWERVSGGLLVEGYGMTESSPVALGNPFWPTRRTGTIGVPFPSTSMKVVDRDDPTREVRQGEPGELLIKGPQVFQGYWKNPEETAKTLLPDGWLRTGDIVTVDEDGFTKLVDRAKEIIITGGFNVGPSEVEAALRTHPSIQDAAVVGKRHGDGSEVVIAVVEPAAGRTFDEQEMRKYLHTLLAGYKVPRRFITSDGALPRSMLGKVLRKQVRDHLPADL